jgi:hypothetical protein
MPFAIITYRIHAPESAAELLWDRFPDIHVDFLEEEPDRLIPLKKKLDTGIRYLSV